jgi:hypothetical protein
MPDGSSSAAPVIRPGPSRRHHFGADFLFEIALSLLEDEMGEAPTAELIDQCYSGTKVHASAPAGPSP